MHLNRSSALTADISKRIPRWLACHRTLVAKESIARQFYKSTFGIQPKGRSTVPVRLISVKPSITVSSRSCVLRASPSTMGEVPQDTSTSTQESPFPLTDVDRWVLSQTDAEFKYHDWEELQGIIGKTLGRYPICCMLWP